MQQPFRLFLPTILALVSTLSGLTSPKSVIATPLTQTGDPVIIAAGDISICSNIEDEETAKLIDQIEGTVLALGDNAYDVGSIRDYNDCYDPTWGRHKGRTRPVPGNHEYGVEGAHGYFTYFGDVATPLQPGCTQHCNGFYSFDLGAWHLIALNSEIGNGVGSEQEQWLRADLAAHPTQCTLAFWHRPRYSSGRHGSGSMFAIYQALYDYGADVVLVGHDHDYERFAPQGPGSEYEPTRGIRQFVVGTGGAPLRGYRTIQPNSEVRNSETYGILKMILRPTSYEWEFIPIPGYTFRDGGSSECVVAPNFPPAAPAPVATTAPAPATTTVSTAVTAPAPASVSPAGLDYTIQAGDTLGTIGARYGLTWQQIAAANGLEAYSILEIGQVIRLPGVQGAASSAPVVAPTATPPSVATSASAPAAAPTAGATGGYVVQAGDTLWSIAVRNNTTWQALAAANSLNENDFIRVGQTLVIPSQTTAVTAPRVTTTSPATTATTAITGSAATTVTTQVATAGRVHTVAPGDTIITIATRYGLNWQTLLRLNGLSNDAVLQVGQQIRLE